MWLGRLRTKGAIEVVLRTPAGSPAAAQLLVWNFNKSIPELGKGVREMQVSHWLKSFGHRSNWPAIPRLADLLVALEDPESGLLLQVYVDGDLTWQGTISRGCGNQTFDYATRIALLETPEAPAEAQAQRLSAEMSSEDGADARSGWA